MPFVAARPEHYEGQSVGNGHCVGFVRTAADAPHTSLWVKGGPVRDDLVPGTAIATFSSRDRYENDEDGSSHCCILIKVEDGGLLVWDQWLSHPVGQRFIRARNGEGLPCDDASQYSVIETDV